ncbi:MAG: hypothetical protein AAGU11_19125 [Syntrophobacteraceae bacterium]
MSKTLLKLILAALILTFLFPPVFSRAQTINFMGSAGGERWDDWPSKNMAQNWNYLFHPERINQWNDGRVPDLAGGSDAGRGKGGHYWQIPPRPEYSQVDPQK